MIELRTSTEAERERFFASFREELLPYEEESLAGLGLTWESLRELFETSGQVRSVVSNGKVAGFVWIERQPSAIHVQSMVLFPEFRGQGIGRAVFRALEDEFRGEAESIGIGTLRSNAQAISYYEHHGFVPSEVEGSPGFINYKRRIPPAGHSPQRVTFSSTGGHPR